MFLYESEAETHLLGHSSASRPFHSHSPLPFPPSPLAFLWLLPCWATPSSLCSLIHLLTPHTAMTTSQILALSLTEVEFFSDSSIFFGGVCFLDLKVWTVRVSSTWTNYCAFARLVGLILWWVSEYWLNTNVIHPYTTVLNISLFFDFFFRHVKCGLWQQWAHFFYLSFFCFCFSWSLLFISQLLLLRTSLVVSIQLAFFITFTSN